MFECFSTLIFGATDTTSGALTRVLDMLAQHPDAQRRLRQEITESRASGSDLDYSDLAALPYLDAVIRETLRL
jgi:cytochrome P450